MNANPVVGAQIIPDENRNGFWKVVFDGPEGTPFLGGKFAVEMDFTDNYPFKAPKVKFCTKIYHPGVEEKSGNICTQAIEQNWVPTLNAKYVIEAILSLMADPSVAAQNPLEQAIANEYSNNRSKWETTAA